jgi:hypothetical protein
VFRVSQGIADHNVGNTSDSNDISGDGFGGGLTLYTDSLQQFCNLNDLCDLLTFGGGVNPGDLLSFTQGAVVNTN